MPLIHASTTTSSSASTPASTQPSFRFTPSANASAARRRHEAACQPSQPAAPTAAVIWTNGHRQVDRPRADVQDRRRAVPARRGHAEGRCASRSSAAPSQAESKRSRVRKGHPLNLANTATGVQYRLLFARGTTEAPTAMPAGEPRARPVDQRERGDRKLRQEHEPNPEKGEQRRDERQRPSRRGRRARRRLRRPRLLTYVSVAALAAAVFVASGSATRGPSPAQPVGLQSFPRSSTSAHRRRSAAIPTFARTPSFAWQPGPRRDTLRVRALDERAVPLPANGLVWSSRTLTTPATAIPLSLPWITGEPASLYWHVRAVGGGSVSAWSDAQAVQHALVERAEEQRAAVDRRDSPGYVRWKTGRRARPATRSGSSMRTR